MVLPELIISGLYVIGGIVGLILLWKVVIPWIRVGSKYADLMEKKVDVETKNFEKTKK